MKSSDKPNLEDYKTSKEVLQEHFLRNAFGERVRKAASNFGLKQVDIAHKSGLSASRVGEYWHGKKLPAGNNLIALADALGVEPGWLMLGDEGSARRVLDDVDRMIEQGGADQELCAAIPRLQEIALDPDMNPQLRRRANFILTAAGDKGARHRRDDHFQAFHHSMDRLRAAIDAGFDQTAEQMGRDVGPAVRAAIHAALGYIALTTVDDLEPPMVNWSVQQIARAILSQHP